MAEHDPRAFTDLFDTEPDEPSAADTARWIGLYSRLVELLERQLVETERFADSVPDALREYLSRENIKILVEELEVFRDRLAHWQSQAS
jgi:hypothetical protein